MSDVWPGRSYPLGATPDEEGTNFSIFSSVATRVHLCLFDADGREERLVLPERTGDEWHGYVPGVRPGQRYGYRVEGPWDPERGQRCAPEKLLVDPYARAIDGDVRWSEAMFAHRWSDPSCRNDDDSAQCVPKSVVVDSSFDWRGDRRPRTPWHRTIVYEAHVRGLTRTHPDIPASLRGTYAGLAHPAAIAHLQRLGITAIELMPVHHFVHDHHLVERGLRNYWGYNTIGFFAPYLGYAADRDPNGAVREIKGMIKALHAAGIEVILDVVYNHTAEGNHEGPTLSFKAIDNASYYHLSPEDARYYWDTTGTGNSVNVRNAHVLQLIMDSLRYWATEMHVDGFRFDLAASLARELYEVDRLASFFDLIQQDPVCRDVKLIAEPWDLGPGGYQVGNFPALWTEWNGKFRDAVRDYWRGRPGTMPELASRLSGSADLYESSGRRPFASINFVTAHDGFTLHDLVSYDHKHNESNGENGQDGANDDRSWNCGVEGPTDDPDVLALRARQKRNLLATLVLSQGVPMISMGDELGRTQGGNNNAYCHDDDTSWVQWDRIDEDLIAFVQLLISLRTDHPIFERRRFFDGERAKHVATDVAWYRPDGAGMSDEDWAAGWARSFTMFLAGGGISSRSPRGERIVDDDFTLCFNAHAEPVEMTIPRPGSARCVLDTASVRSDRATFEGPFAYRLEAHAMAVFVHARSASAP
jgi:isoamylase